MELNRSRDRSRVAPAPANSRFLAANPRAVSATLVSFSILLMLCSCPGVTFAQSPRSPDLVLQGTVHGDQSTGYVLVPFQVPAGTERVSVQFRYTGKEENSTIDLGIQDPERMRGWSGGNKSDFTIGSADATPSYLPGPMPAGEWKLLLGIAHMRPGSSVEYTATIHLTPQGSREADTFTRQPLADEARWYRGDLHLHTAHSDGTCSSQAGKIVPCPLFVSVEQAARHGLDFLAITDHNTTSQYESERELQPYFDKLLLIPGRELTTYSGHANLWGTTAPVDFRAGGLGTPSKNAMLQQARSLGAVVSINHPIGLDAEECIGCAWEGAEKETDMSLVSAIEVINSASSSPSSYFHASDIAFWEKQLAGGFRITAVGGSDTHEPEVDTIGLPTTVVYAPELSVAAILEGIRAGHVFIDLTGSRNLPMAQPRLIDFTASAGSVSAMMGDRLLIKPGQAITLSTHVNFCLGSSLRWLVDGAPDPGLPKVILTEEKQALVTSWLPHVVAHKPHWLRAEVRGPDSSLQLLTNPVYIEMPGP